MKQLIIFVLSLTLFLFAPIQSHAHLGGGPPFLKINDKNADTNPYNQGASTLTIPWDVPPDTYYINEPIKFSIDVIELMKATTVSPELANQISIRWSFATGENFTDKKDGNETGHTITKTFTKQGSYLVIIEAKLPADSDYILINTVQVNVLPDAEYELPAAHVYVGTQYDDVNKNVLLVSDNAAKKYLWDFGEGILVEGQSVTRRFEKAASLGVEQVFHRVIDENGFISDTGFLVENRSGKLRFGSFNGSANIPVTIGTYEDAAQYAGKTKNKLSLPQFIVVGSLIIIVLGVSMWWILKRKK